MNQEAQEYYNIASWTKDKVNYNRISKFNTNKHRQVLHGQIWFCDLGYNVGTEKNKMRPVLVMSNNKINNSEKSGSGMYYRCKRKGKCTMSTNSGFMVFVIF